MSDSARKIQGVFLLFFANVMWGLSFIFSKTVLSEGLPSMTLAFLRYVMTVVILIPLCLKKEGGIRLGKWAGLGFVTTMLGITVYYFFELEGLKRTSASVASLILALVPMMTLLYRILFKRERISLLRWFCVAASLLGVFFVIRADAGDGLGSLLGNLLMVYLDYVWKEPYTAVFTLFLLFSGICTALILWQALLTLESILRGTPFSFENAHALQKAGFLSFLISFASLARVVFGICFYQSFRPLTTYNALFVPVFAMFGLLCLVMSALFRQAAEMKAESDLTI